MSENKKLSAAEIIFCDELLIEDEDGYINGYMAATDGMFDRFPEKPEEWESANYYANFYPADGRLEALCTIQRAAGAEDGCYFLEDLDETEKLLIVREMNAHCIARSGVELGSFMQECKPDELFSLENFTVHFNGELTGYATGKIRLRNHEKGYEFLYRIVSFPKMPGYTLVSIEQEAAVPHFIVHRRALEAWMKEQVMGALTKTNSKTEGGDAK